MKPIINFQYFHFIKISFSKPWMTKQLINAYKKKVNLYKFRKKDLIIMNVGMKKNKNLIAYLRQKKKKCFSAFINVYSKNINEIWKMIKTITYKNMQTISISN